VARKGNASGGVLMTVQLIAQEYKKNGGDYKGEKDESQIRIQNWDEDATKEKESEKKNKKDEEHEPKERGRAAKDDNVDELLKKQLKKASQKT
jgi:hypothetical protein